MIHSDLTLPVALLTVIELMHDHDDTFTLESYYNCFGESGFVLINARDQFAVAFTQSASGDGLVLYSCNRWSLRSLKDDALDAIAVHFGRYDLESAARHILDNLTDSIPF